MTRDFTLRAATLADIPTITAHRRAMFEEMGYSDCAALDRMDEKFKDWVAQKIADAEYRHWFAVDESGAIVAGAGLWVMEWAPHPLNPSGRCGNILNVYTDHAYRHRGLARRLTTLILDWCRENCLQNVVLNASDAGRALYESLGFQPTNEMRIKL